MSDAADLICQACQHPLGAEHLEHLVDYEYAVEPGTAFRIERCPHCGSEWLAPRPGSAELPGFYPPNYHAHNDDHGLVAGLLVTIRGWLRGRKYRALLNGRTAGRLFDVGAGDCRHFEELKRYANWEFAGVEIQSAVAEMGRDAGYDIVTGTLESMDISAHSGRYDVVSMNHVLEHVEDPAEVLRRCYALLKPGGHLIGQLPTNSTWETCFGKAWAGYHYPRHLQIFSRDGLGMMLENAGFEEANISSTPHCQTAISVQNKMLASGWPLTIEYGRSRIYGVILALSLPVELLAWLVNRSGTVDFLARRPAGT
ncbi:MAG: methyltransferase domain-containing protein [Pseudomonadota bacterium]